MNGHNIMTHELFLYRSLRLQYEHTAAVSHKKQYIHSIMKYGYITFMYII